MCSATQLIREMAKVKFDVKQMIELMGSDSRKFGWLLAGTLGPYLGTQLWWRTLYHQVLINEDWETGRGLACAPATPEMRLREPARPPPRTPRARLCR
jgi:hypothetical protein